MILRELFNAILLNASHFLEEILHFIVKEKEPLMHQLSFVYQCIFGFPQTHLKCIEKINSYRVTLLGSLFCVSSPGYVCVKCLHQLDVVFSKQVHMLTMLGVKSGGR